MEITLRQSKDDKKYELCIDSQNSDVGFTLLQDDLQVDFSIDKNQWGQLKTFIDDAIWEFEKNNKE